MDLSLPKKSFNIQKFAEVSRHSCCVLLRCRQDVCEVEIYQIFPAALEAFFDCRARAYLLNPNRREHVLEINCCRHGRVAHPLADGSFSYVEKQDMVFHLKSDHMPEIYMPLGYYQGIGFVFDLSCPERRGTNGTSLRWRSASSPTAAYISLWTLNCCACRSRRSTGRRMRRYPGSG